MRWWMSLEEPTTSLRLIYIWATTRWAWGIRISLWKLLVPLWALWVPIHAIWADQHSSHFLVMHEPCFLGIVEEVSSGLHRWHYDSQLDMGGASLSLGGGTTHPRGAVVLCQTIQVWVWLDRDALTRAYHWWWRDEGPWGEDTDHPRLAGTMRCDCTEGFLWHLHLL